MTLHSTAANPDITPYLRWRETPLTARALLAMSRVMRPLYPEEAGVLEATAESFAYELGLTWPSGHEPSKLISEEPALFGHFLHGVQAAEAMEEYADRGYDIAWLGEWWMLDDGLTERRAIVVKQGDLYYPGTETSERGGEGPMSWSDQGFSTVQATIKRAGDLRAQHDD